MSNYNIGQYRYAGSGCLSEFPHSKPSAYVSKIGGGTSSFQDIKIVCDNNFNNNTDYFFHVDIPQDMNYDMSLNIKLIKTKEASLESDFQFIRKITIPRGGTGYDSHRVVLYEIPEIDYYLDSKNNKTQASAEYDEEGNFISANTPINKVKAMIPLEYNPGKEGIKNNIYIKYNKASSANQDDWDVSYFLCHGGKNYEETDKYNDVFIIASWLSEIGANYGSFDMVFRPVENMFDTILIEMDRDARDYNIQHVLPSGELSYGRQIDPDQVHWELWKVNNLVEKMYKNGKLSRIGVWGRSGLMMSINGEEIKVGPSGYYELDAIPISSLGIVAHDNEYNNNFTIDYQYIYDQAEAEEENGEIGG